MVKAKGGMDMGTETRIGVERPPCLNEAPLRRQECWTAIKRLCTEDGGAEMPEAKLRLLLPTWKWSALQRRIR